MIRLEMHAFATFTSSVAQNEMEAMTAGGDTTVPLREKPWLSLVLAWLIAVAATLGALFIGEVLGREPCSLCWYQRAFMFPLPIILGIASYVSDFRVWRYAMPLAVMGALIALYHSLLYAELIPQPIRPCLERNPCSGESMLIFGLPLPYLALASFVSIAALLFWSRITVQK